MANRRLKQGRYRQPRAELLLMHWLTERTVLKVSTTGVFVEFSRLFAADKIEPSKVKLFVDGFVAGAGTYRGFESLKSGSLRSYKDDTRHPVVAHRRAVSLTLDRARGPADLPGHLAASGAQ